MDLYAPCLGAHGGQKRVLGPLDPELQVVVSHQTWESNSGSLEKQQMFLTTELCLQPLRFFLSGKITNTEKQLIQASKWSIMAISPQRYGSQSSERFSNLLEMSVEHPTLPKEIIYWVYKSSWSRRPSFPLFTSVHFKRLSVRDLPLLHSQQALSAACLPTTALTLCSCDACRWGDRAHPSSGIQALNWACGSHICTPVTDLGKDP